MSYILEALKKSERERSKGHIPTLETAPDTGVSRRALWAGVLLGAGALLLAALAAWLLARTFFQQDAAQPPQPAGVESKASAPAADDTRRDAGSGPDAGPAPDTAGGATAPRRVSDPGEPPAEVRRRVQSLSLNVVSYSQTPERRFVMLNQRIYREADTLDNGVVIKEILPDGALLQVGDHEVVIEAD